MYNIYCNGHCISTQVTMKLAVAFRQSRANKWPKNEYTIKHRDEE